MKKAEALRIINAILPINLIIMVITAITHNIWLELGIYSLVHAIPGYVFAGLLLCHVFLNREWIKKNYFKSRKE